MDWFCLLTQRRYLYDLNKVSNIIDLSNYDDSDKAFYTVNGALQALPIANTGRGFIWNKTTYDKVGAKIPTTLDELYEAGEKFAAYEDGSYYPFACADYVKVHLMIYYLQCKYGRDWIKDNALQYSKEEIAEGLNFIKELEDRHIIPDSESWQGKAPLNFWRQARAGLTALTAAPCAGIPILPSMWMRSLTAKLWWAI
ncbi:extracellular solute-binding protein [Enterocloster sp.]|uniref:extracellular solute-binding protein n=1 Tax=Enterocloster sp. TaxID=2719315 RepID=UPI00399F782B